MTKRALATVIVLLLLLPAVVTAGSVVFAPVFSFERDDEARNNAISSAVGKPLTDINFEPSERLSDDNRFIVRFSDDAPLSTIKKSLKGVSYKLLSDSKDRLFAVSLDDKAFLETYEDIIDYAEPDLVRGTQAVVNDPIESPSFENMGVYEAWDIAKGRSDVIVAVLDTGVERNHEDLKDVSILAGYDAVERVTGVNTDSAGHGTAVIGLIAATADNKIGIAGIAHGVSILPVKVSSSSTMIYSSDLISGIRFAADAGAKVINMSVGGYSSSYAEQEAVDYAVSKGCILVSASGNGGKLSYADHKSYPASYEGVISVASCDSTGKRSDFSQYNDAVDVAAYGESVTVLGMNEEASVYGVDSGTSYSCAFVSGIAALAAGSVDKGVRFGNEEFMSLIIETCGSKRSDSLGYGVINAVDILKLANQPIITGVYNGGIYSESVRIGFNRGKATLDGDAVDDGETVLANGSHTLSVTDKGVTKTINFRLRYNPLSYKFNELAAYASFEFSRGNAFLDGFPYKSGDKITASGKHIFTLSDGDEYVEREFTLGYSLPAVYGVEDGASYDRPIEIMIVGGGTATLDGEAVYGKAVVIEEGAHTLTVKNLDESQSKTYKFTVDFSGGDVFKGDYVGANVAVDSENGVIVLYGDSLVGVRIYAIDAPDKYRYFINTDRVYAHAFRGDNLLLFGDGGVTVLDRKLLSEGEASVIKQFDIDGIYLYSYANGTVFGFGGGNVYSVDTETETAEEVMSFGHELVHAIAYENEIFLVARHWYNRAFILDTSSFTASTILLDTEWVGEKLYFGNGYFGIGNRLYDSATGTLALEFCADSAVMVRDGYLATENQIIEISTGKILGSFAYPICDIALTDGKNYVYGLDGSVAVIDSDIEGINAYGAAESISVSVSDRETVNAYRDNLLYAGVASSAAVSDTDIYFTLPENNLLFRADKVSLEGKPPVPLKYIPSEVVCSGGYIAVAFSDVAMIYIAEEANAENGRYVRTPSVSTSLCVMDGTVYAVSGETVVSCDFDGDEANVSALTARYVSTDGERLYVLDGSELSVLNAGMSLIRSATLSEGKLYVGNAIAIGKNIYNKTNFERISALDSDIIGISGNTVVTENRVFSLKSDSYTGYLGADAFVSVISADNTLYSFGNGYISVCSFKNGEELVKMPVVSGVSEGAVYLDGITASYDIGIGYLDGVEYASGSEITSAGRHVLHIVLPCGNGVSVSFTVEEQVSAIEFLVGDRTMSVGETVTLRVKYLPEGASSLPVKFTCDSDGLKFGEMGEVTALSVGKYTVKAEVVTDKGNITASCEITVRDDLLTFVPESGITVDRDNGLVIGVEPGTSVKTLLSKLYTTRKTKVFNSDGSVEKKYVGTGDRILLYDSENKVGDRLTVVVTGDTDGDGFISAYDLYVQKRILRGHIYPAEFVKAADVNKNGAIADNDYRKLKNMILKRAEGFMGNPDQNLFGKCSIQTVSYVEEGNFIDVAVCISGCKYARGVSGIIEYGEGLEFVEGYGTDWESEFHNFGKSVSFYSYKPDGEISGRAFNVVIGMRFKVVSEADAKIKLKADNVTVSFADGTRLVRFEGIESDVKAPRYGDFEILVANAYSFKFAPEKYDYDVTIPYNSALADISIIRPENSTVSVEGVVVPDSGKGLAIISVADENGRKSFYNLNIKRDDEPKFDTNCRLDTLEIEGFHLDPSFSPDITEYSITVPHGTEKINVYCSAQNSSAEVVIGDTAIYGDGTEITVTVGAPDGESLTYTITVSVLPPEPVESEASAPEPKDDQTAGWAVVIALVLCTLGVAVYCVWRFKNPNVNETQPTQTDEPKNNE